MKNKGCTGHPLNGESGQQEEAHLGHTADFAWRVPFIVEPLWSRTQSERSQSLSLFYQNRHERRSLSVDKKVSDIVTNCPLFKQLIELPPH